MKKFLQRFLLTFFACLGLATTALAHEHEEILRIHQKNGTIDTIATDEVDSIYFSADGLRFYVDTKDMKHTFMVSDVDSITMAEEHTQHEEESDIQRVELTLAAGHFHGKLFHQDAPVKEQKYKKPVQKMVLHRTANGWEIDENNDTIFQVLGGRRGIIPYGLWIRYYNSEGQDITGTIQENGADQLHQHFFNIKNLRPNFDGEAEEQNKTPDSLLQYYYMDTDPWNANLTRSSTKLIGSKYLGQDNLLNPILEADNAIGLKGWFNFRTSRKQFDLRIRLMHAVGSKYIDGKCSPFHKPTAGQLASNHWDVDFLVPINVYADQSETGYWSVDDVFDIIEDEDGNEIEVPREVSLDSLTENDLRLVRSTARAYGITEKEALWEWIWQVDGHRNAESGALWF